VEDRGRRIHRSLAPIAIALVIVYGSLYPFHFRRRSDPRGDLRALLQTARGPLRRGDFTANVLLYLPLGLFSAQAARRLAPSAAAMVAIFSGGALSTCMELLQYYDAGRVPDFADIYANTAGAAIGAAGAILFGRRAPWRIRAIAMERRPFVILLLSCWLGDRLFPFVPVIDLHKYWRAVKPLLFSPTLAPVELYRHAMMWLAAAVLLEALFGIARSRIMLPALIGGVFIARIAIADAALAPAEIVGGALAALAWFAPLSRLRQRVPLVGILFACAVALEALQPFHFNPIARAFGWIPFRSFLQGSVEVNIRSFLEKFFSYGALVWLIARAGSPLWAAVSLGGGLVLCLRTVQIFLPGRSAEITDAIILLIAGGVMKLMEENPAQGASVPTTAGNS
jgi:VanZ family protein